jgi:Contractile injection system tube protein
VSGLAKATLQPLTGEPDAQVEGTALPVQFNPSTLRIQLTSHTEGPRNPAGPAEQHTGGTSTLSLDLHFDSADEGTTDSPVNVRIRTAEIAKYLLPGGEGKTSPPRVRFQWGEMIFEGVVSTMSEDLDFFAATGVPLRAKVAISIQGQDPRFEALATGPGSATGSGAAAPGGGAFGAGRGVGLGMSAGFGAAIGGGLDLPQLSIGAGAGLTGGLSIGVGVSLSGGFGVPRVGVALDGESPPAFAARMGMDPAAWRALAAPGGVGLAMTAGTEVAFPKGVGTAPGVGVSSGSGAASGLDALERVDGPSPPAAPRDAAATGFALARAGGVDAALQTVRQERAEAASTQELHAFGLDGGGRTPAATGAGASPRRPLHAQPDSGSTPRAAPVPPPPRADERATSFGQGVPLRPRRRIGGSAGAVVLGRRSPAAAPAPPLVPTHASDCGCGCGGGA